MSPAVCQWAVDHPAEAGDYVRCFGWSCDRGGCERKKRAARRRKAELAAYRKFPGNDLQEARAARMDAAVAHLVPPRGPRGLDPSAWDVFHEERQRIWAPLRLPTGHCRWCDGEILKPGAPVLNLRRGWHDGRGDEPNCLGEYYAHTRGPEQLAWIIDRDGTRCAACGAEMARWQRGIEYTPERIARWGGITAQRFPPEIYASEFTTVHLTAALEVDHRVALALVVITIPRTERWRYFGPMNLQGLCATCHAAKTREDVRQLKAARKELAA